MDISVNLYCTVKYIGVDFYTFMIWNLFSTNTLTISANFYTVMIWNLPNTNTLTISVNFCIVMIWNLLSTNSLTINVHFYTVMIWNLLSTDTLTSNIHWWCTFNPIFIKHFFPGVYIHTMTIFNWAGFKSVCQSVCQTWSLSFRSHRPCSVSASKAMSSAFKSLDMSRLSNFNKMVIVFLPLSSLKRLKMVGDSRHLWRTSLILWNQQLLPVQSSQWVYYRFHRFPWCSTIQHDTLYQRLWKSLHNYSILACRVGRFLQPCGNVLAK